MSRKPSKLLPTSLHYNRSASCTLQPTPPTHVSCRSKQAQLLLKTLHSSANTSYRSKQAPSHDTSHLVVRFRCMSPCCLQQPKFPHFVAWNRHQISCHKQQSGKFVSTTHSKQQRWSLHAGGYLPMPFRLGKTSHLCGMFPSTYITCNGPDISSLLSFLIKVLVRETEVSSCSITRKRVHSTFIKIYLK